MNHLMNLARSFWACTHRLTNWLSRWRCAAAMAIITLIAADALAALHITTVKAPVFVTVNVGPIPGLLRQSSARREALLQDLAQKIIGVAGSNPDRIVALKPGDFAFSYARLPDDTQTSLSKTLGGAAGSTYETTIAAILQQVIARVKTHNPNVGVSVYGLPQETRDAAATNISYAALIEGLDALVSSRSIILGGGGETEPAAVRRSLSNALRLAGSRPVYYSCNGQWRRMTFDNSPGAVDVYPPLELQKSSSNQGAGQVTGGREIGLPAGGESSGQGSGATGEGSSATSGGSGSGGGNGGGGGGSADDGGGDDGGSGGGGGAGGGGGGGSTGDGPSGGGNGGGSAPPYGDPPITNTPALLVAQKTSASVHTIYAQYAAKDMPVLYDSDIDPQQTGFFTHTELLQAGLDREVPMDYTGPVCLDWEGVAIANLNYGVSEQTLNTQIAEYLKVINKARELRPNAKFGFYGMPRTSLYIESPEWYAHAQKLTPIFNASDVLFPSVYRFYQANHPNYTAEENLEYVRRSVKFALEIAQNKPVYPFMWHRYHDSNTELGYRLIPVAEFKSHVAAIFQSQHNGKRAAGVVWWGADQYFYWIATNYPNGGPPEYAHGPWLAQVFADEIAPGETAAMYFNRIHRRTIKAIGAVLSNVPAVPAE